MKVKCVLLLDALGREVGFSPWLTLGGIYHVMSIDVAPDGGCSYGVVTAERAGEWPNIGSHPARCFEIISTVVPSNWHVKVWENGAISVAPAAWQEPAFLEAFYDRDPATYPAFERERALILKENS